MTEKSTKPYNYLVKDMTGEIVELVADATFTGQDLLEFLLDGDVVFSVTNWHWYRRMKAVE